MESDKTISSDIQYLIIYTQLGTTQTKPTQLTQSQTSVVVSGSQTSVVASWSQTNVGVASNPSQRTTHTPNVAIGSQGVGNERQTQRSTGVIPRWSTTRIFSEISGIGKDKVAWSTSVMVYVLRHVVLVMCFELYVWIMF